jgi:hypothetical protein
VVLPTAPARGHCRPPSDAVDGVSVARGNGKNTLQVKGNAVCESYTLDTITY